MLPRRPDPSVEDPETAGRARARVREVRAVRWGLVASVGIHLLGLGLYPLFLASGRAGVAPATPRLQDPFDGRIRVLSVRELALDLADIPDFRVLRAEPPRPLAPIRPPLPPQERGPGVPIPVTPAEEEAAQQEAARSATVVERLQPTMGDPRLWAPVDREILALTDEERAEMLLRGMIRTWNDSIAVAAALSGQATDWTYTDDEGRRWGLSPGRLHLGDFSIPLPFSFQIPPGRREALARRQWEIDDIERGAVSAQIRETWAERAREIRERMERERRGGG
jgi:hypothetical protein